MSYLAAEVTPAVRDAISGQGKAYGGRSLRGYSTNPITFRGAATGKSSLGKRVKKTKKTVFQGGYAEYRRDVGLPTGGFFLRNTGDLWKDWDSKTLNNKVLFGFSDKKNYDAAVFAILDGRDGMFRIQKRQLNQLLTDFSAKKLKSTLFVGKVN